MHIARHRCGDWRLPAHAKAHALQSNLRQDNSSSSATAQPARSRGARRFAPGWRVTQAPAPRSRCRRSTTCTSRISPIRGSCRRHRATPRSPSMERQVRDVRWDRPRRPHSSTGVADLIVFQCDADFDCAPNNVAEATLKGVTLSARARWRDTCQGIARPPVAKGRSDRPPAAAARAHHGALSAQTAMDPCTFVAEVVASTERYDDAANMRRIGGYGVVNLAAEWRSPRQRRCSSAATTCSTRITSLRPTFPPAARTCSRACGGRCDRPGFAPASRAGGSGGRRARQQRRRRHRRDGRAAAPARRIVTLAPHAAELVAAAGAGIARSSASSSEPTSRPRSASLPVVGDANALDLERIVRLRPT